MLNHLWDIESDFMAVYGRRVDEMTGPEFLALAWRVAAYQGIIRALVTRKQPEQQHDLSDLSDLIEITQV